jgi:restriction system protein
VSFGVFLIRRSDRHSQASSSNPATLDTALLSGSTTTTPKPPQTTAELLERLRAIDWFQFEKLVGLIYRKLGYIVTRRGGANPDGGIDLVIEKDGQRTAVQCKQWKTWNVGVKAVREFLGALTDAGIQKGIFITLRGSTGDANQLAEKHGIEIVNENGLAKMLEATGARFDAETLATLCDTRKFCPRCENEMVLRTAGKGSNAGSRFWGCSSYPKCRYTIPV